MPIFAQQPQDQDAAPLPPAAPAPIFAQSPDDAAAMSPETFVNPMVRDAIHQLFTLPQRAIDGSANDVQNLGDHSQPLQSVGPAVETAMNMMGGSGAFPAEANELRAGIGSRTFYRGVHPDRTQRISTGDNAWDSNLFAADNIPSAKLYGPSITEITAKPDAKILYEGTRDFQKVAGRWRKDENMLQYSSRAAQAAKDAGYDATWFKRQSDVGTAIHNPDAFTFKKVDDQ